MRKLLPCPFCGGEAAVRDIKEPSANGWVGCQRCRCFIDWVKNGKPQAIAAWNRRSDAVPVVRGEWVVREYQSSLFGVDRDWACSECEEVIDLGDDELHPLHDAGLNFCPNCGAKMEGKPC